MYINTASLIFVEPIFSLNCFSLLQIVFANNSKSGAGNVTQGEVEKESYPFVGGWGGGGRIGSAR